jgi:hypothetical protein
MQVLKYRKQKDETKIKIRLRCDTPLRKQVIKLSTIKENEKQTPEINISGAAVVI